VGEVVDFMGRRSAFEEGHECNQHLV
jgi:hypothetical protein